MSESKPLSRQFDDAAQLYDEVRPRYSEELIEYIIAFAALPAQGRIFEVGCGTGQMTLPFAQRGYTVVALDQGERLAALAAQHCQPYPQVRVVPCAFEAWQDTAASYDLQQFPLMAPMFYVTMTSEQSADDLTSIWSCCRCQSDQTAQQARPKIGLRPHRSTPRP